MWWNYVKDFFAEGTIANYILDGYLFFIVVFAVCFLILRTRHIFTILIPIILVRINSFNRIQFIFLIVKYINKYFINV